MNHLLPMDFQRGNTHGTFFKILFFYDIIFHFFYRYIEYPGFQPHGKQMAPCNVMDLLFFFYRGDDVMAKLTCAQGAFYEGSNFRNIIEGKKPIDLEVFTFFLICFFFFLIFKKFFFRGSKTHRNLVTTFSFGSLSRRVC
jgi:hypothetical protein